jgi:hypothetical protein
VVVMELRAHIAWLAVEHVAPPDHFAFLASEGSLSLVRVCCSDIREYQFEIGSKPKKAEKVKNDSWDPQELSRNYFAILLQGVVIR